MRIRNGVEQSLTVRLVFGFGVLLIIQFVMGCSGTTSPMPNTSTSALIGQWRQTHIGIGGELKQCPTSLTTAGGAISCGANDTVEFKEDGTFLASVSGLDVKVIGKWRLDGSTLLVTFTGPPEAAGTTSSAAVQFDQRSDRITINTTTGATPTVANYARE
jgi:hypothetical protein